MNKTPALFPLLTALLLLLHSQSLVSAAGPVATPAPAAKPAQDAPPPLTERDMLDALNASQVNASSLVKYPHGLTEKDVNKLPGATPQDPNDPGNGTTEVSAKVGAFDQKAHMATFTQEVYVESPQFTVTCDKLTCYMHAPDAKPAGAKTGTSPAGAATPSPTPAASPAPATPGDATSKDGAAAAGAGSPPAKQSGGLEKAICEGTVVIIQDKIDSTGTVTRNIGHAKKAIYLADTGDVYLSGFPDVQQEQNTCVALDESTVMVLNRDGHMTVNGLHRTVIKDTGSDTNSGDQ